MDWGLLLSSYGSVLTDINVILMTFLGAAGGVIIGAIPGLTATMGVALLVPFSFGMDLIPSIGLLLGVYCGGMYGGSISAILLHTPGTPSAAATVLDGWPMTQKGEAPRALAVAMFASFCGGMIGALCMTFLSPLIAQAALAFGPSEMFMLAVFGLSVIISISGKSIVKGLIAAFFGLIICTFGMDKTSGYIRFIPTNAHFLYEGIPFIPALIGLFAIAEVFSSLEGIARGEKSSAGAVNVKVDRVLPSFKDIKLIAKNVIMGGFIGTFIGAIPGAGGDISAFVSYGVSKSTSKHPEEFGKGTPEGVAAAESANNGCSGGAMIPLLSLGIPGDSVTAILIGAFVMNGITPGPMMYVEKLDIVYAVFAALLLANLCMLIVGCLGIRGFVKLITIDKKILLPSIMIVSLVGAYTINQNIQDVGLAIVFGIIGYLFNKHEIPLSPILLTLILGPMAESNLRRYVQIADGNAISMFTRPITIIFAVLAIISLIYSVYLNKKANKKEETPAEA
ncbi:MAG: C4-dicarboxylate ABC transporter permease [Christensenellaceae bacterium]|nr:C4-dicarboxylate ABC transporter permease [Christensenellaceae bacterium]